MQDIVPNLKGSEVPEGQPDGMPTVGGKHGTPKGCLHHDKCGDMHYVSIRQASAQARTIEFFLQLFSKRGFDIVVAIASLLMLSPLVLLISLGLKSESPGPIVCRHKRFGLDNAPFDLFEFRTMLVRQEEETHSTRFGQLLRRSGMDKIPHLVNVLRGELSIVGPHPFAAAPGEVFNLPELRKVTPGLVSWAQVNDDDEIANSAKSLDRRIEYDRYYLENRSFSFDMRILLLALLSHRTYL